MNRSALLLVIGLLIAGLVGAWAAGGDDRPASGKSAAFVEPDVATKRLIEGNRRFVNGEVERPHQDAVHRLEVAKKQRPFAVVIACSDSRVCPEIVFDQGLGDLFVIRVAGNTIDKVEMGSVEYAVEHLGSKLVVVLGHERCGAVDAAIKGGALHGNLPDVVSPIKPAVDATRGYLGDVLDAAVRFNAKYVADSLKVRDSLIKEQIAKGEVKVIGARYDLDSGLIDLL